MSPWWLKYFPHSSFWVLLDVCPVLISDPHNEWCTVHRGWRRRCYCMMASLRSSSSNSLMFRCSGVNWIWNVSWVYVWMVFKNRMEKNGCGCDCTSVCMLLVFLTERFNLTKNNNSVVSHVFTAQNDTFNKNIERTSTVSQSLSSVWNLLLRAFYLCLPAICSYYSIMAFHWKWMTSVTSWCCVLQRLMQISCSAPKFHYLRRRGFSFINPL